MLNIPIRTYKEFWPFYLREHSLRICRAWHYLGTTIAIVSILALIGTGNLWFLLLTPIGAYGCAWTGHFIFEKNRPATFKYPWWSLISDFRMYFLWLSGGLGKHLELAGVPMEKAHKSGKSSKTISA